MKKKYKIKYKTVFIIRDGEKFMLHKRPAKGLLAGLYELPNTSGHLTEEEALLKFRDGDILVIPETSNTYPGRTSQS